MRNLFLRWGLKFIQSVLLAVIGTLTCVLFVQAQTSLTYSIGQPNAKITCGIFQGFGAEWDPFFWNTNNQNRGLTQSDWDLITARIKILQPGIIRTMMQLSWATSDPNLQTWNWNSEQMQSVFKYLDFACHNNIDVILTDWGWAVRRKLYNDPTDVRYAQGVASYLNEFINQRGYSCIKYLVLGNEPDNEIQKEFGQTKYERMYRNAYQELSNKGLLAKVKLTGPDMGGNWDFMKNSVAGLRDILGAYDFHRYANYNQTANQNISSTWDSTWNMIGLWRQEIANRDPDGCSKPLFITEMGMDGGKRLRHPKIETYDYAIHMADYGTTVLKTGINAGVAWTMHDVYYFDGDQLMKWGMWRYKDQNWSIRPWGQAFALLMKFAPRGSIIVPIDGTPPATPPLSPYRIAALLRPDGGWSIFLVNRHSSPLHVELQFAQAPTSTLGVYQFDRKSTARFPNQILLPIARILTPANLININVPGETFIVLTESKGPVSSLLSTPPASKSVFPICGP